MRAAKALEDRLAKARKDSGAVVVMDPQRGDVLALVSAPAPAKSQRLPKSCSTARATASIRRARRSSW